ncbi:hypothetical protein [Methanospirillum hungatei]|uniref:class I SAM-dependent methyltransferase n=1 Tax=Methanospirillum hungatei TaxID=2203 RepID=UPI0026EB6E5B|nr:hypothetical protein [Methanospirillum hungatei]MCA1917717.1 hypothetical protein [Methanospirillum hungatei]
MGLRRDLTGTIPDDLLILLPDGYEIIGTIAIISIPPDLMQYKDQIVTALRTRRPSIQTILNKTGDVTGPFRTSQYTSIFGENTITEHREYGFRYRLDVSRVYFSSKMGSERKRITDLIKPGETVFVPFAGVGPYAIPSAARGAMVIAMEINERACSWMATNISVNRVHSRVHIIRGDALQANQILRRKFSRIIIPTPYGLLNNPGIFLSMLSEGGTTHWITFSNSMQMKDRIDRLTFQGYQVLRCHQCGNVAPSVYRWILDITTK